MTDIQNRPFSKNYSGLINQSVIALGIATLCITGQELMRRKRRGKPDPNERLGSRETWEFGYLYQGRSWAKIPSPPTPRGWPLSWVKQAIQIPEHEMNRLRGVDATLYTRFLRGCFWFCLMHTFTTFPILFPIHVKFSDDSISPKSMTRASISSLVTTDHGRSLLWIHVCYIFWLTLSWILTLLWICRGAFHLRAQKIDATKERLSANPDNEMNNTIHPHPHPQYAFQEVLLPERGHPNEGLRLRTVMVSNVPPQLRDEKELKEYFEYYLSRKIDKPSMGLTSSTQPGFINKSLAFIFNRAKRIPAHIPTNPLIPSSNRSESDLTASPDPSTVDKSHSADDKPDIERVVVARKMTELASLLERREDVMRLLETAHIKLAKRTMLAVNSAIDRKEANKPLARPSSRAATVAKKRKSAPCDLELGESHKEGTLDDEQRMEQLINVLGPFVQEFGLRKSLQSPFRAALTFPTKAAFQRLGNQSTDESDDSQVEQHSPPQAYPPPPRAGRHMRPGKTVWDALLSLPRDSLDAYQPLVNLSHLYRNKVVPSIDYYTAKLNLLTSLITENRARAISDYDPVSTAFVTFAKPSDARKACKYLAVHPNNPLTCLVTMAPAYQEVDWIRVMKSSFNVEFVKDWVVSLGVWGFTVFWIFPVSLLVGLVSIQNISRFWPGLRTYLDRHPWEEEVLQSFLPTILVALLALLIPLILLLIAKNAHTITTLSALHDRIMTRYYKFLIVNVLVFFCVGTAVLQSFLLSFRAETRPDVLKVVADSFPTAGPFYVGWLIFTTAMHAGFELALLGLPLIMYPTTKRQVTPRKRAVGIRPRTFNFYYWLPNHLLVLHVFLLFSILNPFIIPFATIYYFVQSGVIKNQLIHIYAKHYEGNGQLILVRVVRYSLDGMMLSQTVFIAYMVVLKKTSHFAVTAVLLILTAAVKILMTRGIRAQFEQDDVREAHVVYGTDASEDNRQRDADGFIMDDPGSPKDTDLIHDDSPRPTILTDGILDWAKFSINTMRQRPPERNERKPNPFRTYHQPFKRLGSISMKYASRHQRHKTEPSLSPTSPFAKHRPPDVAIHPVHESIPEQPKNRPQGIDTLGPVAPRAPPVRWDDETCCDLPYDNPFYSRAVSNALWLPRNPLGTLDLDDTIELKTSITVDLAGSQLGSWLGMGESTSPEPLTPSHAPSVHSPADTPSVEGGLTSPFRDGSEEIALPPAIAQRVDSKEGDIEETLPRRPSNARLKSGTSSRRRPSTATLNGRHPPITYRSFSGTSSRSPRRSASIFSSVGATESLDRVRSAERSADEIGLRPDAHAQAELVQTVSRTSLVPPTLSRARNISAHEAVLREVIAEEAQAYQDRVDEEEAEAEKATTTKSWLISWMFKKPT
ncbi:hypothetical protein HGRIS_006355 [Hohenbuehelia grisea]|uniref:DUF221-domain-containing protein n=1 Tax=Hohenbuehelia grisea TaxID=104357 RepID=A0ABR3K2L6_9AGAR